MKKRKKRTTEQIVNVICRILHISLEEYTWHINIGEKWCGNCKKLLDKANFHVNKSKRDGLNGICKQCNIFRVRQYGEKNRDKILQKTHDRYFADIKSSRERTCRNNATYRKNSPEKRAASVRKYLDRPEVQQKYKDYQPKWRAKNPDKYAIQRLLRRIAGESIDFDENQLMKLRLHYAPDGKCMCCNENKPLQIEHIVPVARGGITILDNIQFLCKGCNLRKHTKTIDYRPDGGEFARFLKTSR